MVGTGVYEMTDLVHQAVRVLEDDGIMCTIPDAINSSVDNFTVVVRESDRKAAIEILHEVFTGKKVRRMDVVGSSDFWRQQGGQPSLSRSNSIFLRAPDGFKPVYGDTSKGTSTHAL